MARNVLAVIDMQNDFIDGALGTKEAEAIVDKVAGRSGILTARWSARGTPISRDIWARRRERGYLCPIASKIRKGGRFGQR